jgi:thiamine biosynthesis lipoprotein
MQLGLGLGALAAAGGWAACAAALTRESSDVAITAAPLHWASRRLNAMGTSMAIQVGHADAAHAERALDAAIAEIRHIEDQMSLFREDSAISQLNRHGRLQNPSAELQEILAIATQVSRRSQGAFDATVQPLWLAFEKAKQQGRLPTPQEIMAARRRVNWRGVQVSPEAITLQPHMGITLNGIAQGYAADKVKARLQSLGIAHALVDAGEWSALGQPAHAGDWTLGLADPRKPQSLLTGIALQGRCLATSADDQCCFSPDFVNHHIFDPRTGHSPPELASVSVLAPSAVMADALTKVFFMAGYARALPLAAQWGVDVLVVDKHGRWQASPGVALRQS